MEGMATSVAYVVESWRGMALCVLSLCNDEQQDGSVSHSVMAAVWESGCIRLSFLEAALPHRVHRLPEPGQATSVYKGLNIKSTKLCCL